ncbi:hypothetical protein [Siccibacter turicensis]|uniref:hypothetical protein n=1 Tax=Siccibacter turicensis TaxID=357233 RepID=UPI000465EB96|nr:hypothetical protein [Siccibacter turicensis]
MSLFTPRVILPLIACGALLTWWLMPHHSAEEEAYYVAVFCSVSHEQHAQLLPAMQALIEGGNSGYALKKTQFNRGLAEQTLAAWDGLSSTERDRARQDEAQCRTRVGEQVAR